jgi:hypothetical protein
MSPINYTQMSEKVQTFLTTYAQEADEVSGFSQRQSKLDGMKLAQCLILGWLNRPQATLNQLTQTAEELGVAIRPQSLDERLTPRAVMLLACLLDKALALFQHTAPLPIALQSHFSAVYLLDSTQIQLPSGLREVFAGNQKDNAAVKWHVCMDYLHGNLQAIEWVEGRTPDQNCVLLNAIHAKSLYLFDLGYFKQETLAHIDAQKGFFISRLQSQTALYDPLNQQRWDVAAWLGGLKDDVAQRTCLLGQRTLLPVRLVVRRVPPAVAEQRRRRAKLKAQHQKKTCTQAYLSLLSWDMFVTNVEEGVIDLEAVCWLYRLRWQIELVFKQWKSQMKIAAIGTWRVERVLCQLYAHLIIAVLLYWLLAPHRILGQHQLSEVRAIELVQHYAHRLCRALLGMIEDITAVLVVLGQAFLRFALREKRKKTCSSYHQLLSIGA